MKHSSFKVVLYAVNFIFILVTFYLGLPLWATFLLVPALLYTQLFLSQSYSFRESLRLEPVPAQNYEKRVSELEANQTVLAELGFTKFDEFYLRTSQDIVVYAYYHQNYPVIFCNAHFGLINHLCVTTKFSGEIVLDTSNSANSHVSFRAPEKMHQAFPACNIYELFERHIQSINFLEQKGLKTNQPNLEKFRYDFINEFSKAGKQIKSFLGPVKVFYLYFFGDKLKYTKTIQQQYLAKTLQLPDVSALI